MLDRQLISAAIWISGAIIGPLALTSALEGDPIPALIVGTLIFIFFIIFVLKDRAIALPILGMSIGGKLNFLPMGLDGVSVMSVGLIVYYFFTYFTMKQRNLQVGPYSIGIPLMVVGCIIGVHTLISYTHSNVEGFRPGLMILLAIVTYFCGVSVSSPPREFLARLPLYTFILSMIFAIPNVLTTYFPDLAPYLYYFIDSVNVDAYKESKGMTTDIVRNGALAGVGGGLELFLLSYFPIYTWWHPHRWWVAILSLIGIALIVSGGYRGGVVMFGYVMMLALWALFSWRSLFVLPFVLMCAYILSLGVTSGIIPLSVATQRSLSFLPGQWDQTAVESASASVDFRTGIQTIYLKEDLLKSPWVGNGFAFNKQDYEELMDLARTSETADHYYESKSFVAGKLFHIGWISMYDSVGVIGSLAFLTLFVTLFVLTGLPVWGKNNHNAQLFPLKVWLFCIMGSQLLGFFTVFGDLRTAVILLTSNAIIIVHLYRIESVWKQKVVIPQIEEKANIRLTEVVDASTAYPQY